jgi:hypothetical protein
MVGCTSKPAWTHQDSTILMTATMQPCTEAGLPLGLPSTSLHSDKVQPTEACRCSILHPHHHVLTCIP